MESSTVTLPDGTSGNLKKLQAHLWTLTGGQEASLFVGTVYAEAMTCEVSDAARVIGCQLQPFTMLHQKATQLSGCEYECNRCSACWRVAEQFSSQMKECVDLLQDLICSAMTGGEDSCAAFADGTLTFLNK